METEASGVGEVCDALLQDGGHVVCAFRVEAVAVDHGVLRGETEDSWLGVSVLGQGSGAADFDDGGADVKERIGDVGVLVQTGRDTDGVGEGVAEDLMGC